MVAINWQDKQILLGEAKWGTQTVGRKIIRELIIEKTKKVLASLPSAGEGWQVHYAFFSRIGFTETAIALAQEHSALLVDLERLDQDLIKAV